MKLSIVDLSTLIPHKTRHEALMNSFEIAKLAEKLKYHRIWFAEHHGAGSVAGRAPEVLIAAVAAQTNSIRVGSGSVLLNHYSPLKVVEVFSTLNEMFPGRIDMGIGRATTGPVLDVALQQDRSKRFQANSDEQLVELLAWLENDFPDDHPFAKNPVPTIDIKPELHILGSSGWSAGAAGNLGLQYVFAGFINQKRAKANIDIYRQNFTPEEGEFRNKRPKVILAVHAVCADSEEEARKQLAPVHIMYRNLSKGIIDNQLPSPDEAVEELGKLPEIDLYEPSSFLLPKFIGGTAESVHRQLKAIANDFEVDELMIQDMMTDHEARKKSFELLSHLIAE